VLSQPQFEHHGAVSHKAPYWTLCVISFGFMLQGSERGYDSLWPWQRNIYCFDKNSIPRRWSDGAI